MPKRLEEAYKRSARKHGYTEGSEDFNRYVYGGMKKQEEKQRGDSNGHDHNDDRSHEHADGSGRETDG